MQSPPIIDTTPITAESIELKKVIASILAALKIDSQQIPPEFTPVLLEDWARLLIQKKVIQLSKTGILRFSNDKDYLELKNGVVLKTPTPTFEEEVKEVGKSIVGAGRAILYNIASLSDEKSKSLLTRFVNYIEKRGEADVPKEWKAALSAYSGFVSTVAFPVKGAFTIFGYSAVALEILLNTRKEKAKAIELENNSIKNQISSGLESTIRAYESQSLEFERNLDLVTSGENAIGLVEPQREIFEKKEVEFVADGATDPEKVEVKKKRDFLKTENLYNLFDIKIPDAENPNIWSANLNRRKDINKFLKLLAPGTVPAIIDSKGNAAPDLLKLYYFLDGNNDAITSEQLDLFSQYIQEVFGFDPQDFFNHTEIVDQIKRDILRIYTNINKGSGDYLTQITNLEYITNFVQIQFLNPGFLKLYKDCWLAGAGIALAGRDALEPQNTQDTVNYHRWAKVPSEQEVTDEKARIEALRNAVVNNNVDFETKFTALGALNRNEVEDSLEAIVRLTPRQTEVFAETGDLFAQGQATIDNLKNAFAVFYTVNPASVDNANLDAVIVGQYPQNVIDILKKLKALILDKSSISESELEMFNLINRSFDLQQITPLRIFVEIQPYFETIYEYYGGNITSLTDDIDRNINANGNLNDFILGIETRLQNSMDGLDILKTAIHTDPDAVRENKNNYYLRLVRGQGFIESNLIDGRDHMGYFNELANLLEENGIIPDVNTLLALVPDLNNTPGAALTIQAVQPNLPLPDLLSRITQYVLNEFLTTDATVNPALKTALFEINKYLNALGFSGKLISPATPPQIQIEYEPRVLLMYLNGIQIGRAQEAKDIFAKHPYGYEV